MLRILSLLIVVLSSRSLSAQLMVDRHPPGELGQKIRHASEVPAALAKDTSLRLDTIDIVFDGGRMLLEFIRDANSRLTLFFPNPTYWSTQAKLNSKQPVAIHSKGLIEIEPNSRLEARLLELMAEDIADGDHSRDETLTLIRVRDCLLNRKPLKEIVELYDPKSWKPRPEEFSFDDHDPFGNTDFDSTSNAP